MTLKAAAKIVADKLIGELRYCAVQSKEEAETLAKAFTIITGTKYSVKPAGDYEIVKD